ncbi:hypothetical protein HDV05_006813, partial [Chytridiales sp. JEL 0842]
MAATSPRRTPTSRGPRGVMGVLLVTAAFMLALIQQASAIYQDQVGLFDWHKELVGVPKFSTIQRLGKRASIFVGTEKNVIASLNPKTGSIDVLTISGVKQPHVRVWDASTGHLIWDHESEPTESNDPLRGGANIAYAPSSSSVDDIVFLAPGGF